MLSRLLLLLVLLSLPLAAQRLEGELRLHIQDSSGSPLDARVELESTTMAFRAAAQADTSGTAILRRLPFGRHRVEVTAPGFDPAILDIDLDTAIPQTREVTLIVAPVRTEVIVQDVLPAIDTNATAPVYELGLQQLREAPSATTGRSIVTAVQSLPGWLLEANAVLHPRGSEYDTQYVIDGMPLLDNRSISYLPGFEANDYEAVHVITAGIPAQYGRRLGGVIELSSRRPSLPGHHPEIGVAAGSFDTREGYLSDLYQGGNTSFAAGIRAGQTDRYLDPPSLKNFTNRGSSASGYLRAEHDLSAAGRLAVSFRGAKAVFQVPNEAIQQEAGQRQDRSGRDFTGQVHYQRVLSSTSVLSLRGMGRRVEARLWSNVLSTPVFVDQDRGLTEAVLQAGYTADRGDTTLRVGGDYRASQVEENFLFTRRPDLLPDASFFAGGRAGQDAGAYADQTIRRGNLTLRAGVRADHYRLLEVETAISPRLSAGYYWPAARTMVHASYDRAFQTPAVENLLLSSLAFSRGLPDVVGFSPVPASYGNFYEVGIRSSVFSRIRMQITQYWRGFENYADDDVFLNTGISLPISFRSAEVRGTEVRLEMPAWGGLSAYASYANMIGRAAAPVTGGLFVRGGEAEELRESDEVFPITQDQRNTVALQVRYQPVRRVWFSTGFRYGSGLPVEGFEEDEQERDREDGSGEEDAVMSQQLLDQVDLERGRVKPNYSLDASLGFRLWTVETALAELQLNGMNLTDKLNIINFAGVFSGTAIAPRRMVSAQLRLRF